MNEKPNNEANEESSLMDCAQFEEIVHDLDRPQACSPALRERALAHAESCSDCAQLMTKSESLDFALRSLAAQDFERQAPARLEAALVQGFRREKEIAARSTTHRYTALLAAAAALLLVFAGSLYERWQAGHRSAAPVASNHSASQPAVVANAVGQQAVAQGNESDLDAHRSAASNEYADNTEDAGAFVPLPYADDPTVAENGAVVRVVLSPSALASLGVPVTGIGSGESVPADLLVSEDGTPQAVRLVSQAAVN
jgi:hypothetical protein